MHSAFAGLPRSERPYNSRPSRTPIMLSMLIAVSSACLRQNYYNFGADMQKRHAEETAISIDSRESHQVYSIHMSGNSLALALSVLQFMSQ